jgi:glycine cleavage system aminomethyltransferase T
LSKRTALTNRHEATGARIAEHHGWRIATVFTSEEEEVALVRHGAGLSDVSWMTKLDLKGPGVNALPALGERARSWSLGPNHLLVTCDPDALPAISSSNGVWVTDVTSAFAQFLLAGPSSRDVLRKLTSLNVSEKALPDSGCGQASVAHVRAIMLRRDLGLLPAFHVLVSREYGESVWDALLHAGHEFRITQFGLKALGMLES